jgi:hypothetical protein
MLLEGMDLGAEKLRACSSVGIYERIVLGRSESYALCFVSKQSDTKVIMTHVAQQSVSSAQQASANG